MYDFYLSPTIINLIIFGVSIVLEIESNTTCNIRKLRIIKFTLLTLVTDLCHSKKKICIHIYIIEIYAFYRLQNDLSYFVGFMVVILRFFTITGKHTTLKMLMLTVGVSVCKSFFIIFGMFLLVFFYALAGTIVFGNVKYGEGIGRYCIILDFQFD